MQYYCITLTSLFLYNHLACRQTLFFLSLSIPFCMLCLCSYFLFKQKYTDISLFPGASSMFAEAGAINSKRKCISLNNN